MNAGQKTPAPLELESYYLFRLASDQRYIARNYGGATGSSIPQAASPTQMIDAMESGQNFVARPRDILLLANSKTPPATVTAWVKSLSPLLRARLLSAGMNQEDAQKTMEAATARPSLLDVADAYEKNHGEAGAQIAEDIREALKRIEAPARKSAPMTALHRRVAALSTEMTVNTSAPTDGPHTQVMGYDQEPPAAKASFREVIDYTNGKREGIARVSAEFAERPEVQEFVQRRTRLFARAHTLEKNN